MISSTSLLWLSMILLDSKTTMRCSSTPHVVSLDTAHPNSCRSLKHWLNVHTLIGRNLRVRVLFVPPSSMGWRMTCA